ncbi:unnamed protein product [Sphagnum troendelagicum]|uniref:Uncharacterized protein n=1 Tax=Sphagnum troendelagicum TaxID=128251 RepID=A0ABP0U3C4_9BRYO
MTKVAGALTCSIADFGIELQVKRCTSSLPQVWNRSRNMGSATTAEGKQWRLLVPGDRTRPHNGSTGVAQERSFH